MILYIVRTHYLIHMVPDIMENDAEFVAACTRFRMNGEVRGVFSTYKEADLYRKEYDSIPYLVAHIDKEILNKPNVDLADVFEARTDYQIALRKAQEKNGLEEKKSYSHLSGYPIGFKAD